VRTLSWLVPPFPTRDRARDFGNLAGNLEVRPVTFKDRAFNLADGAGTFGKEHRTLEEDRRTLEVGRFNLEMRPGTLEIATGFRRNW
jgi:hypothetical protein